MAYYPKSQITTNLYTNGDEYALITTKEAYEGYYYKLSTNKKYVGRNPNNGEGVELIPITPQPLATSTLTSQDNYIGTTENLFDINVKSKYYNNILTNIYPKFDDFERRILPSPYYPTPTDKERLIGEYRRYFAKKNNELIYIEISKETYTKFKSNDPESASDLYECLYLPWNLGYLSGETNKNIVSIVEKNNKWYGFTSYFRGNFG